MVLSPSTVLRHFKMTIFDRKLWQKWTLKCPAAAVASTTTVAAVFRQACWVHDLYHQWRHENQWRHARHRMHGDVWLVFFLSEPSSTNLISSNKYLGEDESRYGGTPKYIYFFKRAIPGLFFLIFVFSTQFAINKCSIKVCHWQDSNRESPERRRPLCHFPTAT